MQDHADREPRPRYQLPLWPRLAIFLFAAPLGLFCAAADPQTGPQVPFMLIAVGILLLGVVYLCLTAPHTVDKWRHAMRRRHLTAPRDWSRNGPAPRPGRRRRRSRRDAMARRQRRK